jgi:hypothetical protein
MSASSDNEMSDVELEPLDFTESRQCIDSGPVNSISIALVLFVASLVYAGVKGLTTPARLLTASETVSARFPGQNVTIDLLLSDLPSTSFYIDLNCTVLRPFAASANERLPFTFTERHRTCRGGSVSQFPSSCHGAGVMTFAKKSTSSDPFVILAFRPDDSDALMLTVRLDLPTTANVSFHFTYMCPNPALTGYMRLFSYVGAATVFYGLLLYILSIDGLDRADWRLLCLGLLGVAAANPAWRWLGAIWDEVLFSAFRNFFRLFVFDTYSRKRSAAVALFFIVFVVVDIAAGLDRGGKAMMRVSSLNPDRPAVAAMAQAAFVLGHVAMVIMRVGGTCGAPHRPDEANRAKYFGILEAVAWGAAALSDVVGQRIGNPVAMEMIARAAWFGGATCCLAWLKAIDVQDVREAVQTKCSIDESIVCYMRCFVLVSRALDLTSMTPCGLCFIVPLLRVFDCEEGD